MRVKFKSLQIRYDQREKIQFSASESEKIDRASHETVDRRERERKSELGRFPCTQHSLLQEIFDLRIKMKKTTILDTAKEVSLLSRVPSCTRTILFLSPLQ